VLAADPFASPPVDRLHPVARLIAVLMMLGVVSPAEAQRLAPDQFVSWAPAAGSAAAFPAPSTADTTRVRSGDHRVEGAVIGGVLLGALGAVLGHEICQGGAEPAGGGGGSSCTGATIGGGLIGAVIGGSIGYFLGKSTPKYRPAADSQ
jgi:hypothetical protein